MQVQPTSQWLVTRKAPTHVPTAGHGCQPAKENNVSDISSRNGLQFVNEISWKSDIKRSIDLIKNAPQQGTSFKASFCVTLSRSGSIPQAIAWVKGQDSTRCLHDLKASTQSFNQDVIFVGIFWSNQQTTYPGSISFVSQDLPLFSYSQWLSFCLPTDFSISVGTKLLMYSALVHQYLVHALALSAIVNHWGPLPISTNSVVKIIMTNMYDGVNLSRKGEKKQVDDGFKKTYQNRATETLLGNTEKADLWRDIEACNINFTYSQMIANCCNRMRVLVQQGFFVKNLTSSLWSK